MPANNDGRAYNEPAALSSQADTPHEEAEAEAETLALCATWEERWQLYADAECPNGCERSDKSLSPSGCKW